MTRLLHSSMKPVLPVSIIGTLLRAKSMGSFQGPDRPIGGSVNIGTIDQPMVVGEREGQDRAAETGPPPHGLHLGAETPRIATWGQYTMGENPTP